ncbi:MAG: thiamine diphosphokinase [Clostridia bacterium]|nr:thiamine diphosphokinase [Clostridia bacterium]NCC42251.1 thiamine diphosphokinase [Clostridia bacterium]
MKTLIITGGNIEEDFALSFMKKMDPDYILGVDRGLEFCYRHQISPDYIVGDFDSLPPEILEWYKTEGKIPIREYNPVKDATDTMIALEKALDEKSSEIWILGGTGTRIDHVLCNIHILKNAWKKNTPAYIVDSRNLITLPVKSGFVIRKEEQYGKYVSFFPLGEEVEGLTLEGFKYPLDRYHLRNLEGLGVSNEIESDMAKVSWEKGILVMIQSRD